MGRYVILMFLIFILITSSGVTHQDEIKLTRVPDDIFYEAAMERAKEDFMTYPSLSDLQSPRYDPDKYVRGLIMIPVYDRDWELTFYHVTAYLKGGVPDTRDKLLGDLENIARNNFDRGIWGVMEEMGDYIQGYAGDYLQFTMPVYYEVSPYIQIGSASGGGPGTVITLFPMAVYHLMERVGRDIDIETIGLVLSENVYDWVFKVDNEKYVVREYAGDYAGKEYNVWSFNEFIEGQECYKKEDIYSLRSKGKVLEKSYRDESYEKWLRLIENNLKEDKKLGDGKTLFFQYMNSREEVPDFWVLNSIWEHDSPDDTTTIACCVMAALADLFSYDTKHNDFIFKKDNGGYHDTNDEDTWDWDYDNFDDYDFDGYNKQKHQKFGNQFEKWLADYAVEESIDPGAVPAEKIQTLACGFRDDHKPDDMTFYYIFWDWDANWENLIRALVTDDRPVMVFGDFDDEQYGDYHAVAAIGAGIEYDKKKIQAYDNWPPRGEPRKLGWWEELHPDEKYGLIINFPYENTLPAGYIRPGENGQEPPFSNIECFLSGNLLTINWDFTPHVDYKRDLIGFNIYCIYDGIVSSSVGREIREKAEKLNHDIIKVEYDCNYRFTEYFEKSLMPTGVFIDAIWMDVNGESLINTSDITEVANEY